MGRLAVSALSKDRSSTAIYEELLVDKKTGQLLIKTPESVGGDVISFDAMIASKLHYDQLKQFVIMNGFIGNIYEVTPDTKVPVPLEVIKTDELIKTPLSLTTIGLNESFIISVDAITMLTTGDVKIGNEPVINMRLTGVTGNGSSVSIEQSLNLTESNTKVFIKSELEEVYGSLVNVTLDSIVVEADSVITEACRTILFGVLLFIEGVE